MRSKNIVQIIVLMTIVCLLSACSTLLNNENDENIFYGTAEADRVNICTETAGRIKSIKVREGDAVSQNSILAELNTEEFMLKLQQAEIAVKIAENELNRLEDSSKKVDERVLDNAKYSLEQAQKSYELAELMVSKGTLLAASDGIIDSINYSAGEYTAPGVPLMTLTDLTNIWVNIYIPERLLPAIKLNQKVELKCDLLPDINIQGEIAYIAAEAEFTPANIVTKEDRTKLVYEVKVKVMDNIEKIRPGMLLEARID